ncbi:hypothetical protein BOTBODRAFT_31461 [Botryobasidium botryosum FD-172 SS1]|uniref:NGG1p interacting factor 3 n=1 Tax=Botryobasidium botryosum (strain FD-172 SS1) TaxID=930990 RepID=A0A067MJ42_BOTB1|nr:hypothetical protein BOTBODRAFT_31461 [Botryobasidium botryosum FD-172 SS1]
MSVVKAIKRAMERIAPLSLAEKWDNVGLLLESPVTRPDARRVMLTIDLTTSVCAEALASPTSMIVAYHPPIFKGLTSLTLANPLQASILRCAAAGVSIYSPHTALDSVQGGVNDWLASGFFSSGLRGSSTLLGEDKGDGNGVGRLVTLDKPTDITSLSAIIKAHLGLAHIEVASPATDPTITGNERPYPVSTIALCAGSGGSVIGAAEADAYFTGEMSHHEVLAAVARGVHVILCGHTNTERGYLPILKEKLQAELGKEEGGPYEVYVSHEDAHPLRVV